MFALYERSRLCEALGQGRDIFEGFVLETNATFPLYMREVCGLKIA